MSLNQEELETLETLIEQKLKPFVRVIDSEAYYAEDYLKSLGKEGLFKSTGLKENEILSREAGIVEKTAQTCMTTAFNIWCHLASLTYIRNSNNSYLKEELLPQLENGELLGGTGISNPMKFYAELETLHLKAIREDGGYRISGKLPAVSNLGEDHWFGAIASLNDDQQVMIYVPCHAQSLTLKENVHYVGVNGSATYNCTFDNVWIPDQWVISENAAEFVKKIRPTFLIYQIPLGLGVTAASIECMEKVINKQNGGNQYLSVQPNDLLEELTANRQQLKKVISTLDFKEIVNVRLNIVYMTLKAVQTAMLHQGSAGYLLNCAPERRLRETYFLANLTPTVRHLEKFKKVIL